MAENIIQVADLSKSFDISSKEPGIKGTLKHFFKRETKSIEVINEVSVEVEKRKRFACVAITVLRLYF